ncbi:MAG: RES family NAD+ phosphorylase [Afipia sp.]|nr:RES family NAD+ phosphorylase [Afipia sp.]
MTAKASDTTRVRWREAWRIIASRYPPIALFERVSDDPAVWDVLIELEQATNPRMRDEAGEIALVPPERRVTGPNASWVMAPFTHVNRNGSRFSDGSYGVYYAARSLQTAVKETGYHFARFAADSNDPPRREDMRVLLGHINATLHDVAKLNDRAKRLILDSKSYAYSRPFALKLRDGGSDGIVYPSLRDEGGLCIAAFWPDVAGVPMQERHLQYEWDGRRFSRWFDYKEERWVSAS